MNSTMAIDQYGHTYHDLGKYPRKGLMDKLGAERAECMYVDKKDGSTVHIGYIIGGLWLRIYNIEPWENPTS